MQEKDKNVSKVNFLTNYGPRVVLGEFYDPDDDTCDQRAPVNDPETLYNTFVVPEEVMSELDSESIEDFDSDIYDYDDRTDLGVDIALSADIDMKKRSIKNNSRQKQRKTTEEEVVVNKNEESVAE